MYTFIFFSQYFKDCTKNLSNKTLCLTERWLLKEKTEIKSALLDIQVDEAEILRQKPQSLFWRHNLKCSFYLENIYIKKEIKKSLNPSKLLKLLCSKSGQNTHNICTWSLKQIWNVFTLKKNHEKMVQWCKNN